MTETEKKTYGNVGLSEMKFASEKRVREFEKLAKEFEELVKKRVLNKEGNRLSSITDAHTYFGVN